MGKLKASLYAKFGNNINLEEDWKQTPWTILHLK